MYNLPVWVLMFAAIECAVVFFQVTMRKKPVGRAYIAVFTVKAACLLLIPAFVMVVDVFWAWFFGVPFTALYIALCGDVVSDITRFVCEKAVHKQGGGSAAVSSRTIIYLVIAGIAVGTVYFACGTYNMQQIHSVSLVYESEKLESEHSFVFVADIHAGASHDMSVTADMIDEISACDPDFVIIGGDVTDEYTTEEEMQEVWRLIGGIDAPVYFVYGNHDRQPDSDIAGGRTYTDEELERTIEENGVTVLKDEYVKTAGGIVLLGREDESCSDRAAAAELENPYPGCFLITADHSPYNDEDISVQKADLQVSGHTHAGQIAPNGFVCALAGLTVYGEYEVGDTVLYVSAGAGGWIIPFRSDARCEYEIITLKPAESIY